MIAIQPIVLAAGCSNHNNDEMKNLLENDSQINNRKKQTSNEIS